MPHKSRVIPYSLQNTPSLIEMILPVQKLSSEAYKEQMAGSGKTLAPLGSYWKGRKPLILNKACILGSLLPATNDLKADLEVFEMLMGMDDSSIKKRLGISDLDLLPNIPYKEMVSSGKRPEEISHRIDLHIWDKLNSHLNTNAQTVNELIEQLGIMRFGHRPKVADTFCGSGQIPFEAARLGCDVYASDLNPMACLLTWGAFNIVGAQAKDLNRHKQEQDKLLSDVSAYIDKLGIESDKGWKAKVFLYCLETKCPQTGWMVPLLPSLVLSKPRTGTKINVIIELIPRPKEKRYDIHVKTGVSDFEVSAAIGTVRSDGKGQEPYMYHVVKGIEYKTKISTLRGDFTLSDGTTGNLLRRWEKPDFMPKPGDIFQERLYAIQWVKQNKNGNYSEYEFRSVTSADISRENIVINYLKKHFKDWQKKGYLPNMQIEPGDKTDEPIRTRGWTYWHHLFNPRQLLVAGLINKAITARGIIGLTHVLNYSSKLSRWDAVSGGGGSVKDTFYNQALNTLLTYGCRSLTNCINLLSKDYKNYPFPPNIEFIIDNKPCREVKYEADVFITDPPYGDAVKYEEILDFFISWIFKNPPLEFRNWTWDSRKALAITGENELFRQGMIDAYKQLSSLMPKNGIQIIMFTHQSGSIWADMANIVWASGLYVSAAWYVVTETDSKLREGSHVKGTVLLVLRKRLEETRSSRDELAWDIQDEVKNQVSLLTGMNQQTKSLYRDENLFADADIQMAGYAAALRVLTKHAIIDGKNMVAESQRPRLKGKKTFVDELIEFAVGVANQTLVPDGIMKIYWDKLQPAERFYLKLIDLESKSNGTLDNYQNFSKAFKVSNYKALMASQRANSARLKSALEFGKTELSETSELYNTVLRGLLYAIMELQIEVDGFEVLKHIAFNIPNFLDPFVRESAIDILQFLSKKLSKLRSDESNAATVLTELIRNQRL
jgi:putative DNA methylase